MPNRYYEKDGSLDRLKGARWPLSATEARATRMRLNLRDSGVEVIVGLYAGSKSWKKAEAAGLRVMTVSDAAKAADITMILLPDHVQADLYDQEIAPHMTKGKTLMFAHGFNIHFDAIKPPAEWMSP